MNEEQKYASEEALHLAAGKGKFERSENLSFPAGPPSAPPVPPGRPPQAPPSGGLDPDDDWEEDETSPWSEEVSSLPDSLCWAVEAPAPRARRRGTLARAAERPVMPLSPQQKLLLLDTWQRSGLPARDFGALVNISRHTLYAWKRRFQELGPAGLMDQPRGVKKGSKLPELTRRTIVMLKQAYPDWGCERISDMLVRGPALHRRAVRRALVEHDYLSINRRSIPQPIRLAKCAGIR
jgi:transposase